MKETLNLLPVEAKAAAPARRGKLYYLFVGLAVYIVVMAGMWFLNTMNARKLTAEIDKLNKQKIELQQKITSSIPVSAVPPPAVDKEILTAMGRTPKWSQTLSALSVVVPQDVWLSSIESRDEKGGRRLSIKGFSTTHLGVANLISMLESSRNFYDVEIVFVQKGSKDVSFELNAKMRWT